MLFAVNVYVPGARATSIVHVPVVVVVLGVQFPSQVVACVEPDGVVMIPAEIMPESRKRGLRFDEAVHPFAQPPGDGGPPYPKNTGTFGIVIVNVIWTVPVSRFSRCPDAFDDTVLRPITMKRDAAEGDLGAASAEGGATAAVFGAHAPKASVAAENASNSDATGRT